MPLREFVEQRIGQVGQSRGGQLSGVFAQRREAERQRRDVGGIERQQRCAAVAVPVIVVYTSDSALWKGSSPLTAPTRPAVTARCGRAPSSSQAHPCPGAGQTRRASRSSPRP